MPATRSRVMLVLGVAHGVSTAERAPGVAGGMFLFLCCADLHDRRPYLHRLREEQVTGLSGRQRDLAMALRHVERSVACMKKRTRGAARAGLVHEAGVCVSQELAELLLPGLECPRGGGVMTALSPLCERSVLEGLVRGGSRLVLFIWMKSLVVISFAAGWIVVFRQHSTEQGGLGEDHLGAVV